MSTLPSLWRRMLAAPIVFYRRFLSRLKPPTCRFHPTCSAYAQEAILTHGALRGGWLSLWRILRCQPFAKGGYDPVPPSKEQATAERRAEELPEQPQDEIAG